MDKFKGKLPKDDLKRFAKEISKKLVSSDFKNHRVEDPTKINSKKEKQIKTYVKDYFDKAAKKHKEREKRRAERKAKQAGATESSAADIAAEIKKEEDDSDGDQDMAMSDDEGDSKTKIESSTPITPMDQVLVAEGLKRKREDPDGYSDVKPEDPESTPSKIMKSETPPPPPPPPPPAPSNGAYPSPTLFSPEGDEEGCIPHMSNIAEHGECTPEDTPMSNAEIPQPPPPFMPSRSPEEVDPEVRDLDETEHRVDAIET